jgi:hypothetical protein
MVRWPCVVRASLRNSLRNRGECRVFFPPLAKGGPGGSDESLPLQHWCFHPVFLAPSRQRRQFLSPPCEGGGRGGGPNTFDTPKFFAPRTQPRPFPPLVSVRLSAIKNRVFRGSSSPARTCSSSRQRRAGNSDAMSEACVPPPLAPPSQGGERKGSRLLGFQSRATKTLASQSCFQTSHLQPFITPGSGGLGPAQSITGRSRSFLTRYKDEETAAVRRAFDHWDKGARLATGVPSTQHQLLTLRLDRPACVS